MPATLRLIAQVVVARACGGSPTGIAHLLDALMTIQATVERADIAPRRLFEKVGITSRKAAKAQREAQIPTPSVPTLRSLHHASLRDFVCLCMR